MIEVVEILNGSGPRHQREVCLILSAVALWLSGASASIQDGFIRARKKVGTPFPALNKLKDQLEKHNAVTEWMDNPYALLDGFETVVVGSPKDGYLKEIDAARVKKVLKKLIGIADGNKDLEVGIRICRTIGEKLYKGENIAFIFCRQRDENIEQMKGDLSDCFYISAGPVKSPLSVLAIVDESGRLEPHVEGEDLLMIRHE